MAVIHNFGTVNFDFGAIACLGAACKELGIRRPLLATDPAIAAVGILDKAKAALPADIDATDFAELPEHPTVAGVEASLAAFQANDCDGFVAIGGGSIIDNCKAATILTCNPGPLHQYAGHTEKIGGETAPIIAVPTTAGAGSEVTRGGGIHPAHGEREFGVGGPMVLPRFVICDPELTLSLPPRLTAGTGMDALGHCAEGFFSPAVNPPVDAIALDGIHRVVTYIERAVNDGTDREARWHMMMAALEGGMAISKGLGIAHALSMTFSDSDLHHGALVTVSLPTVIRFVAGSVGEKMDRLADALDVPGGGNVAKTVADAVADLNERVGLPASVRAMGYGNNDVDSMAEFAVDSWFNETSPRKPNLDDCRDIILEVLG